MECDHDLIFGSEYDFEHNRGSCNACASPHDIGKVRGVYMGDVNGGHQFELITVYSCLGCHLPVLEVAQYCRGINVTQEMQIAKRI